MNRQFYIVDESSATLRALARQALRGKWTESFLAMLIVQAIATIPALVIGLLGPMSSNLNLILSLVITGPISLGTSYYFMNLFRQRSGGLNDLKFGLAYASKAIALYLHLFIRILLWSFLFVIPGIIAAFRYSMAFYILADNPHLSAVECLYLSRDMMTGNKMNYFILMLSFIGWFLVASIPGSIVGFSLLNSIAPNFMYLDPEAVQQVILDTFNHPLVLLAQVPTLIVSAYLATAVVAFYDLANGNLSFGGYSGNGGYDYAAAAGSVDDPFTGERVPFTDVPAEPAPREEEAYHDLPELFDDPELKEAEDRYSGENPYGE